MLRVVWMRVLKPNVGGCRLAMGGLLNVVGFTDRVESEGLANATTRLRDIYLSVQARCRRSKVSLMILKMPSKCNNSPRLHQIPHLALQILKRPTQIPTPPPHFSASASPVKKTANPCAPGSGTSSNPLPPTYTVRPRLAFIPFVFLDPSSAAAAA